MATNITVAWTAPPLSLLAPTVSESCDVGAQWVAKLFNTVVDDRKGSLPLQLTMDYVNSTMPSNWTQPDKAGILAWYAEQLSDVDDDDAVWDYWKDLMVFPIEKYNKTICRDLQWEGDADVSGQGMIVSYYIVAVLSLVWFVAIYLGELSSRKNNSAKKGKLFRILRAFQESSNDFLDATLVFSAAMLLAAITRYVAVKLNPRRPVSAYSLFGSIFMSTFTIFPALVLQTVTGRVRKHWLRLFLWLVLIASSITIEYYYKEIYEDGYWETEIDWKTGGDPQIPILKGFPSHLVERVWVRNCENNDKRRSLEVLLTFGHVWLGVNLIWWLWYLIVSILPQRWKDNRKTGKFYGPFKHAQKVFLFLNGVVCIAFMFAFIGAFHNYTLDVLKTAGPHPKRDGTWTFGQVLALATWVPVVVQLVSILCFGKKSLSAKLSWRYKVVETEDPHQEKNKDTSEQRLPLDPERMV